MAKHKSNGNGSKPQVIQPVINQRMIFPGQRFRLGDLIMNDEQSTISRWALMQLMSQGELPPLEIEKECRYKQVLTIDDYQHMYDRVGVMTRAISIYPEESWKMSPDIYETEELDDQTAFEKAWEDMNEKLHVMTHLHTADEISGIGHFGIVLLGFDDGQDLNKPLMQVKSDGVTRDKRARDLKLTYLRPLSQKSVRVSGYEEDIRNPRFGMPTQYTVGFVNPTLLTTEQPNPPTTQTQVHWSRVLHIADNRKDSNVFGIPRLQPVFDNGFDIRKVLGANGQGYWQGGFPGLAIQTQMGIESPDFDKEATRDEVSKYLTSQQRALLLEGLEAKSLAPQVADPKSHFETHLEAICICIGVPMRIYKGSEEGKIASSQDTRNWNTRVANRQKNYVTPFILREFFTRMFLVGALPTPKKLFIEWPDLNAPTENDRATTAQKISDALVKYLTGSVYVLMPPKEYLHIVLGYPLPLVEAVLKSAGAGLQAKLDKMLQADLAPPAPPGGPSTKAKLAKPKKPGVTEGAGPPR